MFSYKKLFLFLFVILVTVFCLSGCTKSKPAQLSLSEESWYYGEVKPDEIVAHDFILKNSGGKNLTIESVYSSCSCIRLEIGKDVIAPGEEVILKTFFDPHGYEGKIAKSLTIKSDDPENPEKKVSLTITVLTVPQPIVELSQQSFELGTIHSTENLVLKFTLSNKGELDLIIDEVVTEEIFSHNLSLPLILAPGEQYPSEIYMDISHLKVGEFRKAVRIVTNDPKNPMTFLRISGTIAP